MLGSMPKSKKRNRLGGASVRVWWPLDDGSCNTPFVAKVEEVRPHKKRRFLPVSRACPPTRS